MQISARNVLKGTVTGVKTGAVNTEVTIDVGGAEIVSIITKASADQMSLVEGREVYAVIKASNVMVAIDH